MRKAIIFLLSAGLLMLLLAGSTLNEEKVITKLINAPVKNESLLKEQSSNVNNEALPNIQSTPIPAESAGDKVVQTGTDAQAIILLRTGDSGGKVLELQKKLYNIGYDMIVDGAFGNQTCETLKNFQRTKSITPTGSYDTITDVALKAMKETRSYTAPTQAPKPATSAPAQTPKPDTPAPVTPAPSQLLIDKINGKGSAEQAIVVTTSGFGVVSATINTFEKVNGTWRQVATFAGNVGKNGFAPANEKKEGDGKSPTGIFSLGTAFGVYSNPGTVMNYRQSNSNDFWVDDSNSSLYNTWQVGPANGRWASAENMCIAPYNYGFVIDYNTAERAPGKGSAIFFHVWSGAGHGTAGCTATSQDNVISVLKWLKPSKNPLIIQGILSDVLKM